MKRKISVGCTLITDPELLFLDEMSAGVDIVAQRLLWRLVVQRPVGQTIVSTTHSMLEADSTCDRLGILVSGKLRCLGDTARLKQVYGAGHHLELTLKVSEGELLGIPPPAAGAVAGDDDPARLTTVGGIGIEEDIKDPARLTTVGGLGMVPPPSISSAAVPPRRASSIGQRRSVHEADVTPIADATLDSLESAGVRINKIVLLEGAAMSPTRVRLVFGLGHDDLEQDPASQDDDQSEQLAQIFRWCVKDPLGNIEDYGIGEPTMEQVFLRFATEQEEGEED